MVVHMSRYERVVPVGMIVPIQYNTYTRAYTRAGGCWVLLRLARDRKATDADASTIEYYCSVVRWWRWWMWMRWWWLLLVVVDVSALLYIVHTQYTHTKYANKASRNN